MRYVCPECGSVAEEAGPCPTEQAERADAAGDSLLGETVGHYRVTRLLGKGGMGRVYRAVQPAIGARVAIKVLSRDAAEDRGAVSRFFDEARAVNLIHHEKIVGVMDLAELPDGRPYIVMEYLDGAPLGAVRRRHEPFPLANMIAIACDVLDALQAAHAVGIVHRDLKPDNIFLTASGRTKLLDFGIAKLRPEDKQHATTVTGAFLGTPAYVSPEQAASLPAVPQSDLYSMGVILYEVATGQVPFRAPSLLELLKHHLTTPPRPPREMRADVPAALEKAILRALEKEPAARFADAHEMADALRAAAAGLKTAEIDTRPWKAIDDDELEVVPPNATAVEAPRPKKSVLPPTVASLHEPPTPAAPSARATPPKIWLGVAAAALAALGVTLYAMRSGSSSSAPSPSPPPSPPPPPPVAAEPPDAGLPSMQMRRYPGPPDPHHGDFLALVAQATSLARSIYPDAELVHLTATQIPHDGALDLTVSDLTFDFHAPSRLQRRDKQCAVGVYLTDETITVHPFFEDCDTPLEKPPTCTLAAVWDNAQKTRRIKPKLATIDYDAGKWVVHPLYEDPQITLDDLCAAQ